MQRISSFVVTALELTVRLLFGAICGLFTLGVHRWLRHRDWRILGALLRVISGGAIGFVIWWSYLRPIHPDDLELLELMLQIGCSVGAFWAVVWLVFMQPPKPPRGEEDQ
jgi:hypothetical protein